MKLLQLDQLLNAPGSPGPPVKHHDRPFILFKYLPQWKPFAIDFYQVNLFQPLAGSLSGGNICFGIVNIGKDGRVREKETNHKDTKKCRGQLSFCKFFLHQTDKQPYTDQHPDIMRNRVVHVDPQSGRDANVRYK